MGASIAIVAPSSVPFQVGGAEKFWLGLRAALAEVPGHFVDLIKLPAREDTFADIVNSYKMFRQLDLSHFDIVITSKYPAWMIRHPRHVLYFQHPLRGLYDTYHFTGLPEKLPFVPPPLAPLVNALGGEPTPERADEVLELCASALAAKNIPSSYFAFPGPLIRGVVHFLDRAALAESQISAYLAISKTAHSRAGYPLPDVDIKCLHHPSDIKEYVEGTGEYIFTASRLNSMKRLRLLVEAMAFVEGETPLKIAGTGPELEHLRQLAANDPRIEFLGHVPDADLPALYAGAICVPFVPYDEDYGLITLEAMKSGKPVITASDSGGSTELVSNGENGYIVEPTPRAIGHAITRLTANTSLARNMGMAARKSVEHINWPRAVAELMLHAASPPKRGGSREKIIVCAPFRPDKTGSGGERRLAWMCAALAAQFDVLVIHPGAITQAVAETWSESPALRGISLPWPGEARRQAQAMAQVCGISGDDLAIAQNCENWLELLQTLAKNGEGAHCAILSHPWLYPALNKALPRLPFIYDAHNVESALKSGMFGADSPEAIAAAAIEEPCARAAALVFACSDADKGHFSRLRGGALSEPRLLPNGYDSDAICFTDKASRARLRQRLAYPKSRLALFMGSGHAPNQEAARRIFGIAQKLPEVEFLIAGTVGTQEAVRSLPRPENAHLLGIVDEKIKNALLAACDVALNPVTTGSGTNLKIIEYLASGLPVVSTPFGLRGLNAACRSAARAVPVEEFPRAISEILAASPGDAALAAVAKLIRADYSWREIMRPLCGIINDAANAGWK